MMHEFVDMAPADRAGLCAEVADTLGFTTASVEKDFWVCWCLRLLFTHPSWGAHLTFKGGTSLSKCWKLIDRFSEDVDVVIDRDWLGFGGDAAPDQAPSRKQMRKRLDALRAASQACVNDILLPAQRGQCLFS